MENENRPIAKIVNLVELGTQRLTKYEYRFLRLINEINPPLTIDKIKDFYTENVQMQSGRYKIVNDEWVLDEYSQNQIERNALQWFDSNLGKMMRKSILSNNGYDQLHKLLK